MTLSAKEQAIARSWLDSLPGRRGVDIPEDEYDTIYHVGNGITLPMWGRPILPHQIAALHEMGATTPQAIHQALGALPHPNAPNVSVNDYPAYVQAYQTWSEHK